MDPDVMWEEGHRYVGGTLEVSYTFLPEERAGSIWSFRWLREDGTFSRVHPAGHSPLEFTLAGVHLVVLEDGVSLPSGGRARTMSSGRVLDPVRRHLQLEVTPGFGYRCASEVGPWGCVDFRFDHPTGERFTIELTPG